MEHLVKRQAPQESTTQKIKRYGTTMGTGFFMGMFVGSSVTVLHCIMNKVPMKGMGKSILGSGMAFGCIFSFGSLLRG